MRIVPGATGAAALAAGCWAKALAAGRPAPATAANTPQTARPRRICEVKLPRMRMMSPLSLFLNADYPGS
jgi:hypothetical protein